MFRNEFFRKRAELMFYCRHEEKSTYPQIGKEFGVHPTHARELVKTYARYARHELLHLSKTLADAAGRIDRVSELEDELRDLRKRISAILQR